MLPTPPSISSLRKRRNRARKKGMDLFVALEGTETTIHKFSECAPGYGGPGFMVSRLDNEWYALHGAPWKFTVK